jgi:hypothetical protein
MGDLAGAIGATDRAVASYRHALEVIHELAERADALPIGTNLAAG